MKNNNFNLLTLISSFILILVVSFTIFSCQKDNTNTLTNEKTIDYELIGNEHNKGLDYVYNYVKTEKAKGNLKSSIDFLTIAEEGTREFLKNSKLLQEKENQKIAIKASEKPFNVYKTFAYKNVSDVNTENLWTDDVDDVLTDIQKQILNEMNDIVSAGYNIENIIQKLTELDVRIEELCPVEEREILYTATAIGRHSFQYWNDNFNKWKELLDNHKKQFSWSDVGKNDVAYGVGGGAAGAIVGGSVSLGALTVPGWVAGAVGGAVGGSIGNAILQWWD